MVAEEAPTEVDARVVACNGGKILRSSVLSVKTSYCFPPSLNQHFCECFFVTGGGALGHPKVYINLVRCPYV